MLLFISATLLLGLGGITLLYQRKKRFLETPIPLRLRKIRMQGERYAILAFENANSGRLPSWTPGSHIVIEVDAQNGKHRRPYSLMAGDARSWEVAIARQPYGKVSGYLIDHLQPGDLVHAMPPRGRFFRLETNVSGKICLIGGGVGVAPLIAMAQQALSQGYTVLLLQSARHANELIRHEELQLWATRNRKFQYVPVITRGDVAHLPEAKKGRIDSAMLRTLGLEGFKGDFYLCGTCGFVDDQAEHIRQLGAAGRIFKEAFTSSPGYASAKVRVGDKTFEQGWSSTLLAACEQNGILPFAECRTGHCLNCRATLREGKVTELIPAQTIQRRQSDQILLCACVAASDVVLDIPSCDISK